jgi:hypothetical protein
VLVGSGSRASASLPTPSSSHASAEEVFEDGLEVVHVGLLLPPAAVEAAEAAPHVAEYVLILEALEGVFLGGARLVIIFALALIGEGLVGAE